MKLEIYGILIVFQILKICYFSKLNNFRNLMIFEIGKFGNFFRIFQIDIFWNFPVEIFGIFKIGIFFNSLN